MLIPSPDGASAVQHAAIASMAGYLSVAHVTLHADLIREELLQLLGQVPIRGKIAEAAVESADPAIYAFLIKRGIDLSKIRIAGQKIPLALRTIQLNRMAPERRLALFEVVSGQISSPDEETEKWIARRAIANKDLALFDALCEWATHSTPTTLILDAHSEGVTQFLRLDTALWDALLSRLDPNDPRIPSLIYDALRQRRLHALAIFVTLGCDFSEPVARFRKFHHDDLAHAPAWFQRFVDKASSAHGRLAMHKNRPNSHDLITLRIPLLQVKIAGLSNRQRRAIRRKQKARKMPLSLRLLREAAAEAA